MFSIFRKLKYLNYNKPYYKGRQPYSHKIEVRQGISLPLTVYFKTKSLYLAGTRAILPDLVVLSVFCVTTSTLSFGE